jgi:hypothetical protein
MQQTNQTIYRHVNLIKYDLIGSGLFPTDNSRHPSTRRGHGVRKHDVNACSPDLSIAVLYITSSSYQVLNAAKPVYMGPPYTHNRRRLTSHQCYRYIHYTHATELSLSPPIRQQIFSSLIEYRLGMQSIKVKNFSVGTPRKHLS